jgi:hypothetical protein
MSLAENGAEFIRMAIPPYILSSIFLLLAFTPLAAQSASTATTLHRESFTVSAKVDPRVELMSIVARLAGYDEYVNNDFKLYADDVDKHFQKYKKHPAIEFARQLRQSNDVGFDAVMRMAVHLGLPPSLASRVAFTEHIPDRRWGKEGAERFVRLLREFYNDADCESFFRSHAGLYRTAEERFQQLLGRVDFAWYGRFYGERPPGTFNLYIGLLNGGGNYGPKVIHTDGAEELYAIIGSWNVDRAGLPIYDEKNLPTIIHEFNHSFINHLIYGRRGRMVAAEHVYRPVAERMRAQAYGDWETMVIESLVRAAVIRYLFDHEALPEAAYKEIILQRNVGFLWIEELSMLLGVYENSRSSYPTFRSFLPLVEGYYADLAKRIEYQAKRFEESIPRVIALSPITNGAQDVDPAITQLTVTFDRPMDKKGYSFDAGRDGPDHFPLEKVTGYNEAGTAITLQVKLKPDWEYEFVLLGFNFKTIDGYPLQPYTVKFKTKKAGS